MTPEDESGLSAIREAPRPTRQGDDHVGRIGDVGDHPAAPLRVGRLAGRREEDRRGVRRLGPSPSDPGSELVPGRPLRRTRSPLPIHSTRRCCPCSSGSGRRCPDSSRPAASCACSPSGWRTPIRRASRARTRTRSSAWERHRSTTRCSDRRSSSSSAAQSSRARSRRTSAARRTSHALRLDKEAVETIRKARLHQKVATTIFLRSNGGQAKAEADAAGDSSSRSPSRTSTSATSRRRSRRCQRPATTCRPRRTAIGSACHPT